MASNVNPYNINGAYPVAGQDNDSQGFRDNFTNIRSNFTYIKKELEALQSRGVFKTELPADAGGSTSGLDNNFNGSLVSNALIKGFRDVVGAVTLDNDVATVAVDAAPVQTLTTSLPITNLLFTNWPVGSYMAVKIKIITSGASQVIMLPVEVSENVNTISGLDVPTGALTLDVAGAYWFEFSSLDGGAIVAIRDLSRNPVATVTHADSATTATTVTAAAQPSITSVGTLSSLTVTGTIVGKSTLSQHADSADDALVTTSIRVGVQSAIGAAGDKAGYIIADTDYVYVCTADYDGTTHIWKRAALVAY